MTEADVNRRVDEMVQTRQSMLERLEYQAMEDQKRMESSIKSQKANLK